MARVLQIFKIFTIVCVVLIVRAEEDEKIVCNDKIDKSMEQMATFIRPMCPIKRSVMYCNTIIMDALYTLQRGGEVYCTPLKDPDESFVQIIDVDFTFVNFSCSANMDTLTKNAKMLSGKKRRSPMGFDSVPGASSSEVTVEGEWKNLAVFGKFQYSKKTGAKKEVEKMKVKDFNYGDMEIGCKGSGGFAVSCSDFMQPDELKQLIGQVVEVMAGDLIKDMILGAGGVAGLFMCV